MKKQAILMFHGIGDPPPGSPPEEPPYWITRKFFVEIVGFLKGRDDVVLTFDDGNVSDLYAAETLAAAGAHGKFYVLTGRFKRPGYLSPSDLRHLVAGGMEVGLHGTNHVDWRKVDRAELENETTWSRQLIEEVIGKPVTSLAIPFGAYNRTVIKHLDSLSFERIYTSDRGLAVPGQRYLRRNPVMGWQTIRDIEVILEDRVSLPSRARRSIMPLLKRNIG